MSTTSKDIICTLTALVVLISIVILLPADRLYDVTDGGVSVNRILRIILLSVLMLFYFTSGLSLTKYRFSFGLVIYCVIIPLVIYLFSSGNPMSFIDEISKIILWLMASLVVFRLRVSGYFSNKALLLACSVAIPLACSSSLIASNFLADRYSQNVGAYGLLWFIPIVLLLPRKHKMAKIILIAIIALSVIVILKRGVIISMLFSTMLVVVSYFIVNKKIVISKYSIAISFVGIVFFVIFLEANMSAIYERFFINESNRDTLYLAILYDYMDSNIVNVIFGNGFGSVESFTEGYWGGKGVAGHSDFMTFMHSFGLVGLMMLSSIYAYLFRSVYSSILYGLSCYQSLVFSLGSLFCANVYSGQLFAPNTLLFGLVIGVSSAQILEYRCSNEV